MNIAVLGAGAWGTAIACALAASYHSNRSANAVTLWGRETDLMNQLQSAPMQTRTNQRYLPDIVLAPQLQFATDLDVVLQQHSGPDDVLIIATPIAGLRAMVHAIAKSHSQAVILWLCKGIERESDLFPHQIIQTLLPEQHPSGVLSGPSFAQEVARGLPCALVLASTHAQLGEDFVRTLSRPTLRIYHSTDVIGVELGGALKNVLAIAAGISDGLDLGLNARAALLTRGIAEMRRYAQALGANPDTISGLTGVGDLILTATGDLSRNRSVGLQLAQGKALDEITSELGHVAEGALCAHAMQHLARKHRIRAPITDGVCAILDGMSPQTVLAQLLTRSAVSE